MMNLGKMMMDAQIENKSGLGLDRLFGAVLKNTSQGYEKLFSKGPTESTETEVERLKAELEKVKFERDELDKRLTKAYQMDESSMEQEKRALQMEIADGLKLEYKNYTQNLDEECNDDNFLAYRYTIKRIFRTLSRFGVEMPRA